MLSADHDPRPSDGGLPEAAEKLARVVQWIARAAGAWICLVDVGWITPVDVVAAPRLRLGSPSRAPL